VHEKHAYMALKLHLRQKAIHCTA